MIATAALRPRATKVPPNLTRSQAAPRTWRRRRLGARSSYSNGLIAYSAGMRQSWS